MARHPAQQLEKDGTVANTFTITAAQRVAFVLSWCPSHTPAP
ncbi:hypothetical protein [Streptomyces sp. NPDC091416]